MRLFNDIFIRLGFADLWHFKKIQENVFTVLLSALSKKILDCVFVIIISSPEPLGSQGELIVYPSSRRPSSSVRRPSVRPPFSKIFSSETA